MVNFNAPFVSEAHRQWNAERAAEETRQRGLSSDVEIAATGLAAWDAAHPRPRVTVSDVADHVEHIGRVAGRAQVGIGGDFDGVTYLPEGLEGVEGYPNLLVELTRRGWNEHEIAGLTGGNLLRALREAERVAAQN
jgi:membrane dipeptidase